MAATATATRPSEVRELINNAFARAELASLADTQMQKVYDGAHADGSVVANKITNAVENYQAAISCFMKALPFLPDDGSAELVRNEIQRLMARLGQLQQMLAEVTGEPPPPQDDRDRKLLADLLFRVGDRVQVLVGDEWKPGVVVAVDYDNGTYTVQLDDGTTASSVSADRIRAHNDAQERMVIVSEIVESERVFRDQLRFLIKFYLVPLSKPQHWGGQKSKTETVFSQKTVSAAEMKALFGNIEELAGTSEVFHASLNARFEQWTADQKLGDVFITFAPFFVAFALYADCVRTSVDLLRQLRQERASFDAVVQDAQDRGAPPLEDLMRAPMTRVAEYKRLLDRLIRRTPASHPDSAMLRQAYVAIGKVEEDINNILNRKENQRKVEEIQTMFTPPLSLVTPSRLLVRFSDALKRVEGGKPVKRLVWLFNDLVLVGRKSEWMAVGSNRHVADCLVKGARACPEFGPLAFEITGSKPGEEWVFVASSPEEKKQWLQDLKAFGNARSSLGSATQRQVSLSKARRESGRGLSSAPAAPPPLDADWLQLVDAATGKPYYFSPALQRTTWDRPRWRRAVAKHKFDAVDPRVDASFAQGEEFDVMLEGCDEGWATARFKDRAGGMVPVNRLELIGE